MSISSTDSISSVGSYSYGSFVVLDEDDLSYQSGVSNVGIGSESESEYTGESTESEREPLAKKQKTDSKYALRDRAKLKKQIKDKNLKKFLEIEDAVFKEERAIKRKERSSHRLETSSNFFYNMCIDPKSSLGAKVQGREEEAINLVSKIQNSKGQMRPLLIGPKDVGKKSIVEKTAYLLKTYLKSSTWPYKEIYCLDGALLNAKYSSEEVTDDLIHKLKSIFNSVFSKENTKILYIKDIDVVIAREAVSRFVSSTLENPYPVIASISGEKKEEEITKTISELNKSHFSLMEIPEIPVEKVGGIVKAYFKENPLYSNITIYDKSVDFAVKLAEKYIEEKPFPKKAWNLIQECANELLVHSIIKKDENEKIEITPLSLALFMEKKVNIPYEDLLNVSTFDQKRFISKLKENLAGQDDAIKTVSKYVANYKMGLSDPSKPWGVFLFAGSTGVGKTELAKLIAKQLYHNDTSFVRIDGSEFQDKESISRLIGTSPGYIGFEEGGKLTDALRANRHLVVLFDEFEKSHKGVRKLFLQVFDDGRLTDGKGRTVDCTQSIFIMTSNLGSQELFEASKQELSSKDVLQTVKPLLVGELTPELYNRFTAVIPFQPIKKEIIPGVIKVKLKAIAQRLKKQREVDLSWKKELIDYFSSYEFDSRLGMRDFCKYIDDTVVEIIKNTIAKLKVPFKGKIQMSTRDGEIILKMKVKED